MKTFQSVILFLALFSSLPVSAQRNMAEIQGEIADQNAAVIVGATVSLIQNEQTIRIL